MNIYELIDSVEYVSFDIFDTLIKRNIRIPKDVFNLVEAEYNRSFSGNIEEFRKKRILAEKKARNKTLREEITLVEIYDQLRNYYNREEIGRLLEIEVNIEILLCISNKEVLPMYKYAKEKGKKIIITSDMYLDRNTIKKILDNNKIDKYERLYLSNETMLTKYKGTMYDYILKDLKCEPKKILHIGDNQKSDYDNAISKEIKAFKIENKHGKERKNKYNEINKTDQLYLNVINSFIDNNLSLRTDENIYYNIGYRKIGILFYGYLQWIQNFAFNNNLDKLIFFSRDGYLLKEAYDKYFMNENKFETDYMYISRRAIIVPSFNEDLKFDQLIEILGLRKKDTIKSFFSRIGLEYNLFRKEIEESGYKVDEYINLNSKKSNLEKLYNTIRKDIIQNSEKERKVLSKYINQLNINNKSLGVIDIGWRGSMQYSLMNILKELQINTKINGLYLGMNRESSSFINRGMEADGYLFSHNRNEEFEFKVSSFIGLLETFFLAPHGTVIRYKEENGMVKPILGRIEYNEKDLSIIEQIQQGALNFVKDFSSYNNVLKIKINENIAFNNISNLGITPNFEYLKLFREISFSDFDESKLAKPDSIFKYIINPKNLMKDFFSSQWKIGFLKSLFKIPLPYFKLYKIMRKLHEGSK